jgi:hypothetical protein
MFSLNVLNLFSPHGMGERGMGLACGQVFKKSTVNYYMIFDLIHRIFLSGSRISEKYMPLD